MPYGKWNNLDLWIVHFIFIWHWVSLWHQLISMSLYMNCIMPAINEMMRIKPSNNDKRITNRYLFENNIKQNASFIYAIFIWWYWIQSLLDWHGDELSFVWWSQFDEIIVVDALWFKLISHEPNDAINLPKSFSALLFFLCIVDFELGIP